ncbi:hypothetical protein [Rhizobium sp. LC145]|jgi:hypothetical protein|uniref:hypothetical protein n=1 Tax=Rhizobium sp. LC145 TaxID=1120688 RepID=UPI00062A0EFF|nr:hypothetical protein [Rhizobium sp. LC145]KKX32929.1 membrane protein [Rhizobium sp. LC145]TKT57343.1 hypothetical protein FDR95_13770 [Rhizobiaceae bacterium LC148]
MAYIDQIIMFCAGMWMTAAGLGYVKVNTQVPWVVKITRHFRWMGPLLIALSIILLFEPR